MQQNNAFPRVAQQIYIAETPEPGVTHGQPFAPGTGGSQNFRIPAIVMLENGTLVAACDARWDHDGDGAGIDTIVSTSKDGGKSWHYRFANYLGDNGNQFNDLSTSFMDGALGTDGDTVYLVVDLFPAGFALNTSRHRPVAGQNGLDGQGNLRLRLLEKDYVSIDDPLYGEAAANGKYDYYLSFADHRIYEYSTGKKMDEYTVDPRFNITCPDGKVTNLFFADSPYQPYPTNYLYLTSSSDDGNTWSAPRLLNLKKLPEQTLLVGPGNGVCHAANGHMIFTAYEHTAGYERCCLIWMDRDGNWHRSENATLDTWSSESTAVVLSDGTVRVFYRDNSTTLRYTDYEWDGTEYVRGRQIEVDTGIPKTAHNQLSAIRYSHAVNGKEAVFLSTANGGGRSRSNGAIYLLIPEDDGSMTVVASHHVTDGHYAYSCQTELVDGNLGLLYECDDAEITYQTISMPDFLSKL